MSDQIIWMTMSGLIVLPVVIKFIYWLFTGKWPEFVEDKLPNDFPDIIDRIQDPFSPGSHDYIIARQLHHTYCPEV